MQYSWYAVFLFYIIWPVRRIAWNDPADMTLSVPNVSFSHAMLSAHYALSFPSASIRFISLCDPVNMMNHTISP